MKKNILYIFILISGFCKSQQTIMFNQYTFNKAGMNPAASGIDISKELYYAFGISNQLVGIENSPKQGFINLSYTIRPPRSYKRWQNAGFYFDSDDSGLIGNVGMYGNYTLHLLLRKKLILSFGVYAGVRRFTRSTNGFDQNDPAVNKSRTDLWVYPDIIPGFRLSDKKYFFGVSVRQVAITKLKNLRGRKIGGPSQLTPSIYLDYGRMITLSDNLLMMPSLAVNTPVLGLPLLDANVMFYYANRMGLGAGIRNTSFISGTFQIRFLENMTAGFSYSYPINNTRFGTRNNYELMIGIVPVGMSEKLTGRHSIARCPTLNY